MVDNARSSNLALIEQVKQVVDSRLEELDQLSRQVTTYPKLNSLLRQKVIQSGEELYPFLDFMKEMERYRNGNSFIHDFYVFFNESGTILTPSMKTDLAMFYNHMYGYQDKTIDEWKDDILLGLHHQQFLPSAVVMQGHHEQSMITYVQSLPIGERNQPLGTFVVLINEKEIQGLLEEIIKANHGTIYIRDALGNILLSTGSDAAQEGNSLNQDDNMMTVSTRSSHNGWEYISVVPDHVFWEKVNMVKTTAIILLLCSLAAGTIVCYLMTKRAYRPLKEIISYIRGRKHAPVSAGMNEYELIKSSVLDSYEKQEELQETLYRQTPVIRSNFLGRLLKGYVDVSRVETDGLKMMGISLPYRYFAVIIIRVDDCSGFVRNNSESEWALISFVIGNISEEIPGYRAYSVELEKEQLAVILNLPDRDQKAAYEEWMEQLKQIIEKRFKTMVTIAASQIHEGLERIPDGFNESLKAMDYSIFKDYQAIIKFEDIGHHHETYYDYPLQAEVQLINYIKSGDLEKVTQLIGSLYHSNFEQRKMTPELGRLLFSNLISTLYKLLNDLGTTFEEVFGSENSPFDKLFSGVNMEELYHEVLSMYERLCMHVNAHKSDSHMLLVEKMKQYINQHYTDPMLSLVSIADHFQITSPYLSAFFKKHSGMNISDYTAKVRIEHAKRLMRDAGLTITQIALSVGYANDVGFIRMFKKHEGITPGKYKEMIHS
ncbi:AraC family transcriptional regulator [Marinicrinis lubricantis]